MIKAMTICLSIQLVSAYNIYCDDGQKLIDKSMREYETRRKVLLLNTAGIKATNNSKPDFTSDLYSNQAIANLVLGKHLSASNKRIQRTAEWFEHPMAGQFSHKNVCDFAALKLCQAWLLFKNSDKLEKISRQKIVQFFLTQNFKSIHQSENHLLLFRTSRYLMAHELSEKPFKAWGETGRLLEKIDLKWLKTYIRFRARRGWGEFDSASYFRAEWECMIILFDNAPDDELRNLAGMMLDLLLIDMAVDSLNGMYGGAHGRIYIKSALDHYQESTRAIQYLYFGNLTKNQIGNRTTTVDALVSKYRPKSIILDIALNRSKQYENKERKHLHNLADVLPKKPIHGSIRKYTFWTPDYVLGCVQKQDKYPTKRKAPLYARMQQHDWDLSFATKTRARLFSHHPGSNGYGHGYWTGDIGCNCSQFFQNKQALLAIYNINKSKPYQFIHAYIPIDQFDEVVEEKGWIFVKAGKGFAALKMLNGYQWYKDKKWSKNTKKKNRKFTTIMKSWKKYEVISIGPQNAVICEAGLTSDFANFPAFRKEILKNKITYNKKNMSLTYQSKQSGTLYIDIKGNRKLNGKPINLDYKTYDNPFVNSEWDSGLINIKKGSRQLRLDFRIKK